MGLQCGIVGLPNVGKSTLFNALSNAKAEAANYPFCTIEPNVGVITVPDERLKLLETLVNPEKVIPTVIEFVDIAGLVKGASKGEGLGNKFLANIREVDAIIHVVRCFEDNNIVHVAGKVDPVADKEIIDTELQLKDLESIDKKIAKTEKTARAGDAKAKKELATLQLYKAHLEAGQNARSLVVPEEDKTAIEDIQLLTAKPVIYATNVDEASVNTGNLYNVTGKTSAISGYTIQIAAYNDFKNAVEMLQNLRKESIKNVFIDVKTVEKKKIYKILVGDFNEIEKAEEKLEDLLKIGYQGFIKKY